MTSLMWYFSLKITIFQTFKVKLTTGVNFTNILPAAFALADPKSTKWHWWLDCLFLLLGSLFVKADRKMLVKFTIGRTSTLENPAKALRLSLLGTLADFHVFTSVHIFQCFRKMVGGNRSFHDCVCQVSISSTFYIQLCLFMLLGITNEKAVCRALMKSSPGVNFINI
jgi:hypothetical protein